MRPPLPLAPPWLLALAWGCGSAPVEQQPPAMETGLPMGFPALALPDDNPQSAEKIELGRWLFYDKRLSGNGSQACSSCHEQALAFSDAKTTPEGSTGELLARNSSSLTNAAYNATLTWANPSLTQLEAQFLVPIFGEQPVELGVTGNERAIIERLSQDERYPSLFAEAFPDLENPLEFEWIVQALASFVRTMISGNSPFDKLTYQGQSDALSASALRGFDLFFSERLECHHCHGGFNFSQSTVSANSTFSAARFNNTGLYNTDGSGAYPANNTGLFDFTGEPRDMGKFRAPTLRNIAVTAPYMHDGSVETLADVLDIYAAGGRNVTEGPYAGDGRLNPLKSGFLVGFTLTDSEREDVVHFLESLTDEEFLNAEHLSNPFEQEENR